MTDFSQSTVVHTHTTNIPDTITVPLVLVVVFGVDRTIHWKVVVALIENTVNDVSTGVRIKFRRYNGLFTISCRVNDLPLIIHVTGTALEPSYPQLMVTSLPLLTVLFSGGVVIVTAGKYKQHHV